MSFDPRQFDDANEYHPLEDGEFQVETIDDDDEQDNVTDYLNELLNEEEFEELFEDIQEM